MVNPEEMGAILSTDRQKVEEITQALLRTLNDYLARHQKTAFPDVVLGVCSFSFSVLEDQANRMGLSPEQRESYYQSVLGTLNSALQGDIQRRTTESYTKPISKGVRN